MANPEEAIVVTSGDSDESTHVEEATPQTPAAEPEVPIEVQPGSGEPEEQAQEKPQPQFVEPRHSFYEDDSTLTIDVFDKGINPADVSISFQPRALLYQTGNGTRLELNPLKGQIDPIECKYSVLRMKVEIRLKKLGPLMRWGSLVGDAPDILAPAPFQQPAVPEPTGPPKLRKNWDSISAEILSAEKEKEKALKDDPNAGGDTVANSFFQDLFANADEDTKRAMMKSYVESNGTTLSTNWEEVGKGRVKGKAPEGSVMRKWGT